MTRTQNRRARENPGAFGVRRTRFFTGLRIPRRACAVNRFERVLDNDMTSIAGRPRPRAPPGPASTRVSSRVQWQCLQSPCQWLTCLCPTSERWPTPLACLPHPPHATMTRTARPAGRPKAKRTYQVVPGYAPGVAAPKTYALWTPDPGVRTLWTP